jgi:paxillin
MILPAAEHEQFCFRGKKYFVCFPNCLQCTSCLRTPTVSECCVYGHQTLLCRECFNTGSEHICAICGEPVFDSSPGRFDSFWFHAEHFKCVVCSVALKNNTAIFVDGVLKCRTCSLDEKSKCKGCKGETAGTVGVVTACGSQWHPACFLCQFCQKSVMNDSIVNIQGKPSCLKCYRKKRADGVIDRRGGIVRRRPQ